MKATKINELESVYEAAIKVVTGEISIELENEYLEQVFAPTFFIYGFSEGERSKDLQELRRQMDGQRKKWGTSIFTGRSTPVFRTYSPEKKTAVYVDEFNIGEDLDFQGNLMRISTVLFKTVEGWRVTHLHLSLPSSPTTNTKVHQEKKLEERETALEKLLEERTTDLNDSLEVLKATQEQLLRQEKLASLGQLTAGIAHEIKNPLNFINNFSELSSEFLVEIEEQLQKLEVNEVTDEVKLLLEDVKANLAKIHQHGTRADGIVKSMLLHSRGGNGKMEDIDLNTLIKEYANLAFHGMRANKNPINVDIKIDTDPQLGMVKMNAENFSRVILNLCKNAFDAMRDKLEHEKDKSYVPTLKIKTIREDEKVIVEIEDNGPGVPEDIKEKLITPFFTTKKGNEGTGLGLSISMDIIQSHGGRMDITSKEGEFTRFTIELNKNGPERKDGLSRS